MSVVADAFTPLKDRIRERRRVQEVVSDLVESSRTVETPSGLVTMVGAKFLRELTDVTYVTGEVIYAVVDETHLARTAQVAGLINRSPIGTSDLAASPHAVRPDDIAALIKWRRWTLTQAATELGVSIASISNWKNGMGSPRGENRVKVARLVNEMRAAIAAEKES